MWGLLHSCGINNLVAVPTSLRVDLECNYLPLLNIELATLGLFSIQRLRKFLVLIETTCMVIKLLETLEETSTKIQSLTGLGCCLREEDKRNCHAYVTSIMTITFLNIFLNKENIISCYFSICVICFVAFVCILYRVLVYTTQVNSAFRTL